MFLMRYFEACADYHPSPALRAFQYVLLALIVLGIGLLVTESLWVPYAVEYILAHEGGAAGM